MTGVLPPPGGGVTISGSTPAGGQMTPSDRDNFSLGFPWPCVSVFERSVGSTSVEHFCCGTGVSGASGRGRSCAWAIAATRIETDSAAIMAVGEIGLFMTRSVIPFRRSNSANSYLELVVPALSFPRSRGTLFVGALLFGCVVVTPLASVVTDSSFGGSYFNWPGAPEVGPAPEVAGSSRCKGGC